MMVVKTPRGFDAWAMTPEVDVFVQWDLQGKLLREVCTPKDEVWQAAREKCKPCKRGELPEEAEAAPEGSAPAQDGSSAAEAGGSPGVSDASGGGGASGGGVIKGMIGLAKSELGLGRADAEAVASRQAVCQACPENDLGRCRACGCYLWAKVRLKRESCPKRKW